MNKKIIIAIFLLAGLYLIFFFINSNGNGEKYYKVLYVASYHKNFSWVVEIEEAIKNTFKEKNIPIIYKSYYMDTKRKSSPDEIKNSAKKARELIKTWEPDVVVVSDDNATKYVALQMRGTKYKFSFCGVNNEPKAYGLPASNITGVLERHRFVDTIKIFRILAPHVKNVIVLSEKSPSSDLLIGQFKAIIPHLSVEVKSIYQSNSFGRWKEIIRENQNKTDAVIIILYFTLKDELLNPIESYDVVEWITANSKLPEISVFSFFVEDGGVFADAVNGYSQGHLAATKAIQMLQGEKASEIKIETTTDGIIYINAKRAKDLNLIIPSDLIEGAKIIW